ncbi:MAG TPA: DNA translocase FtsK 4TM domain-containing protein [Candidatus Limnocylindrales bacterium]|nr:DNA translocase FtsK 4TM domain-containing protein [Candidatus Limnocylindrales bacterium]
MAQRRRTGTRAPARNGRRKRGRPGLGLQVSPDTARSLLGVTLLALGAVTLIALALPGRGALTDWWRDRIAPWVGTGRWLLPFLLLGTGVYLERARRGTTAWQLTLVGLLVTYVGLLGLVQLTHIFEGSGGHIGRFLAGVLSTLVTPPGAFVSLVALTVAGLLLALDTSLRTLVSPFSRWAMGLGALLVERTERPPEQAAPRGERERERGRAREATADEPPADLPTPTPSPAPMSQTVWAGARERGAVAAAPPAAGAPGTEDVRTAVAVAASPEEDGLLAAEDAPRPLHDRTWSLPPLTLLDLPRPAPTGARLDHERNIRIIEEKLRSFQIPATVTGTNTGPVVTQYEVRPDARIKLSRIEGLADDLAMALAARSIRIEAPIPGKDVVGIEIPNHSSEIVSFRGLIDDANMLAATSRLTFALGRDVSGGAYAVDLAKMPHLLIAGATGSGKSVCVNALITSLLMRARPDEVRLILVDLKRVELSAYGGLPHLLTDVIVEPGEAKAALHWAVAQMEERYKALAERTERNIAAYNASPRVEPEERLPYIVVVIDELADLMMREGRKVEEPIVKLAQKARAVGIHLVLATQRPSVNVVTGLIKANVPSRIAFAMASNIDSRTVLDQPGAEDLIGRGDMLYQPADLPRPVRLQGVYVSDAEVHAVTDHWREQAPEPHYDPAVVAYADSENGAGGQFAWLAKMAEDEMTARAAELVAQTGKASTSMLQTKLKVGFNRASRLMDELERYGVVGPQDPRNPATPRAVYGPDNWLRSLDDVDDPGD